MSVKAGTRESVGIKKKGCRDSCRRGPGQGGAEGSLQ